MHACCLLEYRLVTCMYYNNYRVVKFIIVVNFIYIDTVQLHLYFYFQTRHAIEKVLDWENSHLFHKVSVY